MRNYLVNFHYCLLLECRGSYVALLNEICVTVTYNSLFGLTEVMDLKCCAEQANRGKEERPSSLANRNQMLGGNDFELKYPSYFLSC